MKPGPFNLEQLTSGTSLASWPTSYSPEARPKTTVAPITNNTTPREKSMSIRSEVRAAIEAAPGITFAEIVARFPEKNVSAPIYQMCHSREIRRDGKGVSAKLYVRETAKAAPEKAVAKKKAQKTKRTTFSAVLRKAKQARAPVFRDKAQRDSFIETTLAALRQRRERFDRAIATLEELAHMEAHA